MSQSLNLKLKKIKTKTDPAQHLWNMVEQEDSVYLHDIVFVFD